MIRKIIEIDEQKCNGCGLCIPNCPEGAIQLIDGKARLVSDLCCDGLGACLGECPQNAIRSIEREAEPYDEKLVMANLARQGANTVKAHLIHLKEHGESELYRLAVEYLAENGFPIPDISVQVPDKLGCGCPGTMAKSWKNAAGNGADAPSELRQWPVQLQLLNPDAPYFDDAELLVTADCAAYAMGGFHAKMLRGKILAILCPKLDHCADEYVGKLAEIFRKRRIKSVTVARMAVPCCGGAAAIVEKALAESGKSIPLTVKVIELNGDEK